LKILVRIFMHNAYLSTEYSVGMYLSVSMSIHHMCMFVWKWLNLK